MRKDETTLLRAGILDDDAHQGVDEIGKLNLAGNGLRGLDHGNGIKLPDGVVDSLDGAQRLGCTFAGHGPTCSAAHCSKPSVRESAMTSGHRVHGMPSTSKSASARMVIGP